MVHCTRDSYDGMALETRFWSRDVKGIKLKTIDNLILECMTENKIGDEVVGCREEQIACQGEDGK